MTANDLWLRSGLCELERAHHFVVDDLAVGELRIRHGQVEVVRLAVDHDRAPDAVAHAVGCAAGVLEFGAVAAGERGGLETHPVVRRWAARRTLESALRPLQELLGRTGGVLDVDPDLASAGRVGEVDVRAAGRLL